MAGESENKAAAKSAPKAAAPADTTVKAGATTDNTNAETAEGKAARLEKERAATEKASKAAEKGKGSIKVVTIHHIDRPDEFGGRETVPAGEVIEVDAAEFDRLKSLHAVRAATADDIKQAKKSEEVEEEDEDNLVDPVSVGNFHDYKKETVPPGQQ